MIKRKVVGSLNHCLVDAQKRSEGTLAEHVLSLVGCHCLYMYVTDRIPIYYSCLYQYAYVQESY